MGRNDRFQICLVLLSILNFLDIVFTQINLSLGAREANPIMDYVINNLGWVYAYILKGSLSILILILAVRSKKLFVTNFSGVYVFVVNTITLAYIALTVFHFYVMDLLWNI